MFYGLIENLRRPFNAVTQAVCVAVLALLSLVPPATGSTDHAQPVVVQSSAPRTLSFGSVETATQRGGTQRRVWVARLNLFELRIERDSSHGSASWSVTILIHESDREEDSTPGAAREQCI
jgi:hypothetical protein